MRQEWIKTYWGELATLEYGKGLRNHRSESNKYSVYGGNGKIGTCNQYLCDKPGVIVGRKGDFGIHFSNSPFYVIDTAYWLNCNEKVDPRWAYYQLRCYDINVLNSGSSVPSLSRDVFYSLPVLLPPLKEQRMVANVLELIDQKIDLNKKTSLKIEKIINLIYEFWFLQFDFPNCENMPYKSSGGEMVFEERLNLSIPKGWSYGKFGDFADISGGSTPSKKERKYFTKNGIPWITPADMSKNTECKFISKGETDVTEEGKESASLKIFPTNTTLMTSRAPIGYLALARNEVTTNQGFKSFIPNKGFSDLFVFCTVKNTMDKIINYSFGSTFNEISTSVLKNVEICLPPKKLSYKFAEEVSIFFEKQKLIEIENEHLTQLLKWLSPHLINGTISLGS